MFCWLKLEMFILQFLLCIINQAQLLALPRPFPSALVQPHFIFSHKIICIKFPGPSWYFSVYKFDEFDRGNFEICFYIRDGMFGTSLKQLYFAVIPYLPTLLYSKYWKSIAISEKYLKIFQILYGTKFSSKCFFAPN